MPKQLTHLDMTIKQSILKSELSTRDRAGIFDKSKMDFKLDEKALLITDEQNMIATGKENEFQIISQVELTGCLQRNHIYLY
jgi:hypothetical protein